MRIAILDNGICFRECRSRTVSYRVGSSVKSDFVQDDPYSHATVCAKIIEKYSAPDELIDIAYAGNDGTAELSDLCDALELALSLDADIINLSCGIDIFASCSVGYQRLLDICRELYVKGVIIFAAQSNDCRVTIPAAFPYTVSVEQADLETNVLCSLYRRSDIYTNGNHFLRISGKGMLSGKCNSYACAYAAARAVSDNADAERLRSRIGVFSSDVRIYSQRLMNAGTINEFRVLTLCGYDRPAHIYLEDISRKKKQVLRRKGIQYLSLSVNKKKMKFIQKCAGSYSTPEVPIVFIQCNENSIALAKELTALFFENGYYSVSLSTQKNDFFSGAAYVPEAILSNYLRFISFNTRCDILFVIADSFSSGQEDDVFITFHKSSCIVRYREQTAELCEPRLIAEFICSVYQ